MSYSTQLGDSFAKDDRLFEYRQTLNSISKAAMEKSRRGGNTIRVDNWKNIKVITIYKALNFNVRGVLVQ